MSLTVILLFVLFSLFSLLALTGIICPRKLWWLLEAWKYQNPQANEPSATAYFLGRIIATLALVFFLGILSIIPQTYGSKPPHQEFKLPPPELPPNLTPIN